MLHITYYLYTQKGDYCEQLKFHSQTIQLMNTSLTKLSNLAFLKKKPKILSRKKKALSFYSTLAICMSQTDDKYKDNLSSAITFLYAVLLEL